MSNKMWMVRAEGGFYFEEFRNKNVIAIGWHELPDLSNYKTKEAFKNLYQEVYKESKPQSINISAGQVYKFKEVFSIDDYTITYDPSNRLYIIGQIISDYIYDNKLLSYDMPHIRKVKWIKEIDRDQLSTNTKNSLGSSLTVFNLSGDCTKEILSIINDKKTNNKNTDIEEDENLELIQEDIISKANEFIKDKIIELSWENMENFVEGIFKAIGYKTKKTPKGPDHGYDIMASPDVLGLEQPRIIIEVKHREGQTNSQMLRSFISILRQGDKGVYISTSGFTKDAKYEAERSNNPITLIDLDSLKELVIQYYDNFDTETKTLIPLKKIYWPL